MAKQFSLFDGKDRFKTNKPIRLIELFAGVGSQAMALKAIGANFETHRICEFDKFAVQSYNAIHGTSFVPSDITKTTATDLAVADTDKYCYIMTYSFPCQDLSQAGKGAGTRSGLLWEVERLLTEMQELPQVLVMENVPQVLKAEGFAEWLAVLEKLGYKNAVQVLDAKDYGVPQNRKRAFMISLLGDFSYEFPKAKPLAKRLRDMLEHEPVDPKYYLVQKQVEQVANSTFTQERTRIVDGGAVCRTLCARDFKSLTCVRLSGSVDEVRSIKPIHGT